MFKTLLTSLFLLSYFKQSYTLECLKCVDCDKPGIVTEKQVCNSVRMSCASILTNVEFDGNKMSMLVKGCMPPANEECKKYLHDFFQSNELRAALDGFNKISQLPSFHVDCRFCNEDLCNSSDSKLISLSFILSVFLLFFLRII